MVASRPVFFGAMFARHGRETAVGEGRSPTGRGTAVCRELPTVVAVVLRLERMCGETDAKLQLKTSVHRAPRASSIITMMDAMARTSLTVKLALHKICRGNALVQYEVYST